MGMSRPVTDNQVIKNREAKRSNRITGLCAMPSKIWRQGSYYADSEQESVEFLMKIDPAFRRTMMGLNKKLDTK